MIASLLFTVEQHRPEISNGLMGWNDRKDSVSEHGKWGNAILNGRASSGTTKQWEQSYLGGWDILNPTCHGPNWATKWVQGYSVRLSECLCVQGPRSNPQCRMKRKKKYEDYLVDTKPVNLDRGRPSPPDSLISVSFEERNVFCCYYGLSSQMKTEIQEVWQQPSHVVKSL